MARAVTPRSDPERLLSLDAFRGFTVAAMVLVNNPGTWRAVYPPLRHADWHGWTLTDVIFPTFLFVVGAAVPLALGRRREVTERSAVVTRVLRRAVVLFALGLVLNVIPWTGWTTFRIPGVLQRIAVCYLVAALLFLTTTWRTQATLAGVLLLGYWAVMGLVSVPGYGAGDLSKAGSLAAYLDRLLFGSHLWPGAYDPEGLLSTVPALATTLLGVLAGHWLRSGRPPVAAARGLALGGGAGVALGLIWSAWFPVNKALWTSSYAVFMAGLALLGLAACYWAIEVRGARGWARPLAAFGVNALALYFLSSLTAQILAVSGAKPWLYERLFAPWAAAANASLAYAVVYVLVWWALMGLLYRAGLRVRV